MYERRGIILVGIVCLHSPREYCVYLEHAACPLTLSCHLVLPKPVLVKFTKTLTLSCHLVRGLA